MRKSGLFVVLAVVVLLVVAAWFLVQDDRPKLGSPASPAAANGTVDATAPAAANPSQPADSLAARVEEAAPLPPPGNGRYSVRGSVRFAADGRPAAGARVRVFDEQAPLARLPVQRALSEMGSNRKPAAEQDLTDYFGDGNDDEPKPEAAPAAAPPPEHDHAAKEAARREDKDDSAPLAETLADADGRFEVLGLERKGYSVDAVLPFAVVDEPVNVDFKKLGEQTLKDGVVLELVAGAQVRGRVTSTDGKPVGGAEVALAVPFDPYSVFNAGGIEMRAPAITRTAADGTFRFLGLPAPLEVKARAHAEGFADSGATSVSLRAGLMSEVELTVVAGATIVARVTDDQGVAVAGALCRCDPARIQLDQITSDRRAFRRGRETTDATGIVRFTGLAAGKWRVNADLPGRLTASQAVELAAGASSDVELRLLAGREMHGTVRAKDGTLIGGAEIVAHREATIGDIGAMTGQDGRRKATSGDDGTFVVTGLPEGDLMVDVSAKGYQASHVKAAAGPDAVEIVLATRGALEGIVVSRKTMKPVTRFDVKVSRKREFANFLKPDESTAESFIDVTLPFAAPNGKFRITGVNPGTLRFVVKAADHGEYGSDWITLTEGETRRGLLIYLEPEAVIEGLVVDALNGAPLSGAKIRRDTGGGSAIDNVMAQFFAGSDTTSDDEGRFRLGGLSAGGHRFVVSHEGYVETSPPEMVVSAGETLANVRVELAKGGEIYGAVHGIDRAPVAGASLICQETTRMKMRSVKSDAKGDYRIDGLPPGSYTLTKLPASFELGGENFMAEMTSNLQTQSVKLKAGESLRVDFDHAPQGRANLEGTVKQSRRPVAGALVSVFVQGEGATAGSGGMKATTTGADGSFLFEGLVAGPAFVQVNESDMGMAGGASAALATVTLRDGETTSVALEIPAGGITGIVVDDATGAPLAGIAIYASGEEGTGQSTLELASRRAAAMRTDGQGAFRLKNLRSGRHRVVAGSSDFLSSGNSSYALLHKDGVVVPDGGTVDIGTLRLPRAARIEGTVSDATGKALSGASIFLRDPASGIYLEEWTGTSSNDSGHFEYVSVPEGSWDVVCRAPGHATRVVRSVSAHEGQVSTIRIELIGGTEVFADVGTVDFEKLVDLHVEVEGPDGRIPLTLFGLGDLTDLLSRPWQPDVVRLGRFGPGDYRVSGRLGDKTFEKKFKLAGEAELHVPIALP